MIDTSIVNSGGSTYLAKSYLEDTGNGVKFKVLFVYEVQLRNGNSWAKKKTVFDSKDGGEFNKIVHKTLFQDIANVIGKKYHVSSLIAI